MAKALVLVCGSNLPTLTRLDGTEAAALQSVANRPILAHVLEQIAAAGIQDVAIVGPERLRGEVESRLPPVAAGSPPPPYLECSASDDLTEALRRAAPWVGEDACLVHRGDGLLGQPLAPLLRAISEEPADMAMLVQHGSQSPDRLGTASRRLLRVAELDPAKSALGTPGVCAFAAGALQRALQQRLTVAGEPELAALALGLSRAGGRVRVLPTRDWRRCTGRASDLLELNRMLLDRLEPFCEADEDDENRFEGTVSIHPTATIVSSVISGPVIVGAGAWIADAYVGPYTAIGENVRVECAEIERSIILAGARILHAGGRLESSVVGRDAEVFRDFSLPRAMRLRVGDGVSVALC